MILFFIIACARFSLDSNQRTVKSIRFDGNGSPWSDTSDFNVRTAMLQKKNASFSFLDPKNRKVPLDPEVLRLDAWRIENWYAHNGYFDAKFLGWAIHKDSVNKTDVSIVGRLREGKPSNVRSVRVKGNAGLHNVKKWEALANIMVNERFTLEDAEYYKDAIMEKALNASFAYTSIEMDVDVWPKFCGSLNKNYNKCYAAQAWTGCQTAKIPRKKCLEIEQDFFDCGEDPVCLELLLIEHENLLGQPTAKHLVDITYHVNTGPSCRFGEIVFHGNTSHPLSPVIEKIQDSAGIYPGSSFNITKIYTAQERIYSLGLFSVVKLDPVLKNNNDVLPLHVTLNDSKVREVSLGGGVTLEDGNNGFYLSARYDHRNFLNNFSQIRWRNEIGLSSDGDVEGDDYLADILFKRTPTADLSLLIDFPYLNHSNWFLGLDLGYSLQVESNIEERFGDRYRSSVPRISPTLRRKFPLRIGLLKNFELALSYSYALYRFIAPSSSSLAILFFERDRLSLVENYSLSYITQQFIFEGRDDPLYPKNGFYSMLAFSEAGKIFGGTHDYWRLDTDLRYFFALSNLFSAKWGSKISLRRHLMKRNLYIGDPKGVLAFRLSGNFIFPYWDGEFGQSPAPLTERMFLGGGTTLRGWANNSVGPYECELQDCSPENITDSTGITFIGGDASLLGGVEFRRYWESGVGIALLYDVGQVWGLPSNIRFDTLQQSVGFGLRYKSPIGPIRIDYACRIDPYPYFGEWDNLCRAHLALAESY